MFSLPLSFSLSPGPAGISPGVLARSDSLLAFFWLRSCLHAVHDSWPGSLKITYQEEECR